jgi:hypothetical protein
VSRQILEITLRLPDGQVLKGRGRNVPATMEHIYNQALHSTPRRRVKFIEPLKATQDGFRGAYQVQFGYHREDSDFQDGIVGAEVAVPV